MRLIKIIMIVALLAICFLLSSCSSTGEETSQTETIPVATNMAGTTTSDEVCNILLGAGLSNVNVFNDWTADFAGSAGTDAGLMDDWVSPDALQPDIAQCMDGWERHHDYSDADCRMTAFLLMDGLISSKKQDTGYDGTYLMFDVDAIENAPKYEVIRKNLSLFTTLFGDRKPIKGEDPAKVFGRIWEEYGFRVKSDKASLLSLVMYDPDFDRCFVGHTGVLVQEKGGVLFVEKIAFEQPYQATRAESLDQLLEVLSKRPEYYGEEGDPGPFVYLNGTYKSELEQKQE